LAFLISTSTKERQKERQEKENAIQNNIIFKVFKIKPAQNV